MRVTFQSEASEIWEQLAELGQALGAAGSFGAAAEAVARAAFRLSEWDSFRIDWYSHDLSAVAVSIGYTTLGNQVLPAPAKSLSDLPADCRLVNEKGAQLILQTADSSGANRLRTANSVVLVPIKSEGRLCGMLQMRTESANSYASEDVRLLQRIADFSGATLERAHHSDRQSQENQKLNQAFGAECRQATLALQESEQRFRAAFENAAIGMALVSIDGRLLEVNPALCAMLGYSDGEILSRPVSEIVFEEDQAPSRKKILGLFAGDGDSLLFEKRFRHKRGHVVWVRVSASVIRDDSARPLYLISQIEDITKRREAEATLRRTSETLRALIHAAPVAFVAVDPARNVTMWNPAAEDLFGFELEEVVGRSMPNLGGADASREDALFRDLLQGERLNGASVQPLRKDGTRVEANLWTAPLHNEQGQVSGALAIFVDMSARRQLEAQLLQSQKMEAVGRLAGGVAHDFNNLLLAILGYATLLKQQLPAGDSNHGEIREIIRAAERATSLTRQLLAYSRKQVLQPKILDLNSIVTDMNKLLRRLIGEDVELVTRLGPRLGLIKADPGQLEQVLVNLSVNARDAMPRGGKLTVETVNLEIREGHPVMPAGHYVVLTLSDTGTGMTEAVRSRLFEPFFTTKEPGKGTGLGLSTVYGIVTQSGGHIEVKSAIGEGSTFQIYLPRVEGILSEAAKSTDRPAPTGTETVLLVEDDVMIRRLMARLLQKHGYRVLEAENGEEALGAASASPEPIHLLLTDVVMPRLGGRELSERLRGLRPDVKVLYISGYTDDRLIMQGQFPAGASFLQKPFKPAVLLEKVREVLDHPEASAS